MSGNYNIQYVSRKVCFGDKDHWVVEVKEIRLDVGFVNHIDTRGV